MPYNGNGLYSMKSGYMERTRKVMCSDFSHISSLYSLDSRVWKEIWSLKVPSKIKVFLWRACSNALPSSY